MERSSRSIDTAVAIEKSIQPRIKSVREPRDACEASPGRPQSPAAGMRMPVKSQLKRNGPHSTGQCRDVWNVLPPIALCRDAVVTVMQTADFWNGDNATS